MRLASQSRSTIAADVVQKDGEAICQGLGDGIVSRLGCFDCSHANILSQTDLPVNAWREKRPMEFWIGLFIVGLYVLDKLIKAYERWQARKVRIKK